jgi:hypothetical protein
MRPKRGARMELFRQHTSVMPSTKAGPSATVRKFRSFLSSLLLTLSALPAVAAPTDDYRDEAREMEALAERVVRWRSSSAARCCRCVATASST